MKYRYVKLEIHNVKNVYTVYMLFKNIRINTTVVVSLGHFLVLVGPSEFPQTSESFDDDVWPPEIVAVYLGFYAYK